MASMKDIKTRIRSVESTQQITRAMELVATSKLRHARERVERSRPFHEVLGEAIAGIQAGLKETPSVYSEVRPVKKTCFVVIGGQPSFVFLTIGIVVVGFSIFFTKSGLRSCLNILRCSTACNSSCHNHHQ